MIYLQKRIKLIELALNEYGVTEVPGKENNPRIMQYFREIGKSWVQNDETSWCSAFVNWICMKAGAEYSGELNARSWLKLGLGKEIDDPKPFDIAIFWRVAKDDWRGHVGFYINETADHINVLGGNQRNMVCIESYPKEQLLAFKYVL